MSTATVPISGLARLLVQHGRLAEADAEALQSAAGDGRTSFIERLLTSKKLTAKEVAEFSSQAFGYPLLDLDQIDFSYIPPNVLDAKLMQTQRIVPLFKRGTRLFIGISDITNMQAVEEVRFKTGQQVEPIVVEDNKLLVVMNKLVEASGSNLRDLTVSEADLEISGGDDESQQEAVNVEVDDAPVVKYIQKILLDAINAGASDIHFEPYEKFYRIRYRQDGVLREIAQPPLAIKEKIASRIKVISKLDISEKRVPQDGRMKLVLSKSRAIDFRVSTLPTLHGEKNLYPDSGSNVRHARYRCAGL